jgi:hypothetical protein
MSFSVSFAMTAQDIAGTVPEDRPAEPENTQFPHPFIVCPEGKHLIGAGTIINPILKVVTTVAILGAVYLFIVQPVLDTTEEISSEARSSAEQASREFDLEFARDRAESFSGSLASTWPEASREVRDCVRAADSSVREMQRCEDFAHRLVTNAQSNRNFALSYADSLRSQGKTAEAAQVERCVDDAEFRVQGHQGCRDLADRLLFP